MQYIAYSSFGKGPSHLSREQAVGTFIEVHYSPFKFIGPLEDEAFSGLHAVQVSALYNADLFVLAVPCSDLLLIITRNIIYQSLHDTLEG